MLQWWKNRCTKLSLVSKQKLHISVSDKLHFINLSLVKRILSLLKAIPMKFKEVIAVNNKLEKVCDRYVTVLNNTLKPTKPLYKMLLEKHSVHPTKSQEK
jgi:hypothetical protein